MIDIAPKALRFARLAAEQQVAFADDPQIAMIRQQETLLRSSSIRRVHRYVGIPEATAEFCVRVMTAFLEQPDRFRSSEWDGNDYVFLQAVTRSLADQLKRPTA